MKYNAYCVTSIVSIHTKDEEDEEEEKILVFLIKNYNRSVARQLRDATNKKMKDGRKYIPLSPATKTAVSRGCSCTGSFFCMRFDEKHADITLIHSVT